MTENQAAALHLALQAVIHTAQDVHVDMEELKELTIERLLQIPSFVDMHVEEAIEAIEAAIDSLPVHR